MRLDDENRVEIYDPREDEKKGFQIEMAEAIIRNNLVDGKIELKQFNELMKASGIADWTARRAKKRIGMERNEIDGVKYLQQKRKK